ncbi:TonB-dependent receptor [Parapedobacter indicus]|uniref:TonB-linked outer membrane protein, SusC/RagA family n=1 Tax=Parapedobacter indicus TaxID=1477437 RepID=A0A1I3K342_9SPHI|nr:TonB-dependent receptor [Parapedobacter indicus]PPL01697.1 TonB-linked SusC/RagA family outer membrane protein [Parapedobacter indicus]SFI66893.1 TonB-linked outer membrane protein, SusC/RagA family [Parapedobacter indicus]
MKINAFAQTVSDGRAIVQIFRIMRIIIILLTAINLQAGAYSYAQQITLNARNVPLYEVLEQIEQQSGYLFFWTSDAVKTSKISIQLKNVSLERALNELFSRLPYTYRIKDRSIVLQEKMRMPSAAVSPPSSREAERRVMQTVIRGKVSNERGEPLSGVSIKVKGTSIGTATDTEGIYQLAITDAGTAVLEFSFLGYKHVEERVRQRTSVDVILEETASDLDEVVVVGYGEQKKATVTGSIATVSGEKLETAPTVNFSNSLAGRLPGLTAVTRGSEPGKDDAGLRIRGTNTLGDNSPLVVIDGIANRSLTRLNPADILSVTVLKDASAAIYGAQAANGVILVTTKRGRSGKPVVQVSLNQGWNSPTVIPEMADAASYAQMINEVSLYRGSPQPYSEEQIQKYNDGSDPWLYPNTDWFNETFKPRAGQRYGSLSVNGGSDHFKYFVSLGSNFQDGIYKNSATNYSQANIRSNFDVKVSEYIDLGFNLLGRQENRNYPTIPAANIWAATINGLPTVTAYWPNGLPGPDTQLGKSPLMATDATGYQKDRRYIVETNLRLDIAIPGIDGLSVSGNASFDKNILNDKIWKKPWTLYSWDGKTYDEQGQPVLIGSPTGYADPSLSHSMTDGNRISLNTLINYQKSFADTHHLKFLIGGERITTDSEFVSAFRRYFPSTALDQLFAGGDLLKDNNGSASTSARLNAFGRINYDYLNKYLVEFVWRYDGSYIFPEGKQFGFFPGVSLGWVISDENFWKESLSSVNYFKIRGSWGQTGNDRIAAYQFLSSYALGGSNANYMFDQDVPNKTLSPIRIPNPSVTWEVANQTNIGFDGELFGGQFKFSADYFYNLRSEILAFRNASVPESTGLTLPRENIGEVVNQGFEAQVSYYGNTSAGFTYGISVNGGFAKNKIKYWDESPGVPDYQKSTGHPIGSKLNYQVIGIFRDQAAIDAYPHIATARPGDLIFEDVNNDGSIDGRDMKMDYRSDIPTLTGGMAIDLGFKNFYATILFQGAAGAVRSIYMESEGEGFNYLMQNVAGRWTPDNIDASKPRAYNRVGEYWRANPGFNNTYYTKNNNYLRLKNIEIGYSLSEEILKKFGVTELRVYLSGQNLLTFTKLKDFDPESAYSQTTGTIYPNDKTSNIGLALTF